jgi:hypothetical protein
MKALPKLLGLTVAVIALGGAGSYWAMYVAPFSKLKEISRSYDPSAMSLKSDRNDYLSFAVTTENVQVGLIKLSDGTAVKFWFLSHHVNNGVSLAIFRFPDGTEATMEGYFCCGLEFVGDQPRTAEELRFFIKKHDGMPV